ncbi:MAG TPA: hypothetical protein PK280_14140 [Planctomycetota bacterium]|nr:hypothetical protein [Planctomycetota bacterium]
MSDSSHLEEIRPGVLAWLDSVAEKPGTLTGRWKYNRHMERAWALESSATAVMALGALGELGRMPEASRRRIADALNDCQDPKSGLFRDPLIAEADRVGTVHSWEHIWQHHTGACAEALELLGAAPRHPLPRQAFEPLRPGESAAQVLALGWQNPWLVGEHFYRMVGAYRLAHPELGASQVDDVLEAAFAALERDVIGRESGLPDARGCKDPRVAAAGLFKVLFAYLACGRSFPAAARAVDSVLALQDREGGFGMDNMCIHWDCAWVLRTLNRQLAGSHRPADLRAAGERLAGFLLGAHRKPDGAFSFLRGHCLPEHNSVRVSEPMPESDMIGTFMACDSLKGMD